MVAAGEVDAGNLQVAAIDVALVERYTAVDGQFLIRATAHGVVCTFDHRAAITVGEGDRAIFGIVHGSPDTRFGLNERLVAVSIELRGECSGTVLGDGGVLVECVGIVHGDIITFSGLLAVADVVVGVLVLLAIHRSFQQVRSGCCVRRSRSWFDRYERYCAQWDARGCRSCRFAER